MEEESTKASIIVGVVFNKSDKRQIRRVRAAIKKVDPSILPKVITVKGKVTGETTSFEELNGYFDSIFGYALEMDDCMYKTTYSDYTNTEFNGTEIRSRSDFEEKMDPYYKAEVIGTTRRAFNLLGLRNLEGKVDVIYRTLQIP